MPWWDDALAKFGTSNAPFGLAPNVMPQQAGAEFLTNIGMGMLANPSDNPMAALSKGYMGAKNSGRENSRDALSAKVVMDQMEEKKRERAKEMELEAQFEQYVSGLNPKDQALARLAKSDWLKAQIKQKFPDGDGGAEVYGTPQWFEKDGVTGYGVITKSGGFKEMTPPDGSNWIDPRELQTEKAGGKLAGDAPRYVVDQYVSKIRPEMESINEGIQAVQQAKAILGRGIQTGSAAEIAQAARGWGQALGINVDESVLSNTQAYQNFIGQIVVPRMKELGGNDSNQEMQKMYSLSGGDITQMPEAMKLTLDYTEKLMRKKLKTKRQYEKIAVPYVGMDPVIDIPEWDGMDSAGSAGVGEPDISKMSDQELEDYYKKLQGP